MNPMSRKYKKEYAFELIKIARGDIDSAIGLIQSKKGRPENIVYMCQQAIEKTIKSVICFQNLPILHTHDLEALIVMLPSNVPPIPDSQFLGSMSQYANVRRYEEGSEELSASDLNDYVELTEKILAWGQIILGIQS